MSEAERIQHEVRLILDSGPAEGVKVFALGCNRRPEQYPRTCVLALAGGWITTNDLCPRCTRVFIGALEAHLPEGSELAWHESYAERAGSTSTDAEQSNQDGQGGC